MNIKNRNFFICVLVILLFVVLTFIMTFPLFTKVNSSMPGFHSTDEPSVWYFWWLKYAHISNLDHRSCQYLAYPYGQDYGVYDSLYPLWSAFKRVMALTTNPCFSYNIEIILSFILSGFFVYLLMMFISKDIFISIFSGVIFAFSPYHFARAWQHIGLAHIQWMPLYLYALFKLQRDKKLKDSIFVFIAFFLIASFDYYYLYFMLLVTALFIIFCFLDDAKANRKVILYTCLSTLFTLSILLVILWPFIKMRILAKGANSVSAWSLYRPFEDLFIQSARPLSYFLPSTEHPLLGWITQNFIGTDMYGISLTEHALYLGWVPIILSFMAFLRWTKRRDKQLDARENFYLKFFIVLVIFTWFFSQPPWWNIFGFKLYMPSFFMYKITAMFRAYCRFGIVLMLAVAALAGFGLKFILVRFKTKITKIFITMLFCGLVLFEFWNYPPFKVIDLSRVPQVYYWLKGQPGNFVIAEYPLDVRGPNEKYKFYQTKHEKKMINGTIPGTPPNKKAQELVKLSDLKTAAALKQMGVRYVLVHRDSYVKTDLVEEMEELDSISKNVGLRMIKSFSAENCPVQGAMCLQKTGPIDVYEISSGKNVIEK